MKEGEGGREGKKEGSVPSREVENKREKTVGREEGGGLRRREDGWTYSGGGLCASANATL